MLDQVLEPWTGIKQDSTSRYGGSAIFPTGIKTHTLTIFQDRNLVGYDVRISVVKSSADGCSLCNGGQE